MRRARWIAAAAAATTLIGSGAARANQLVTVTIPPVHAAIGQQWVGYSGPPRANVLLPSGYDPHKAYPLLLLLHGLNCNYNWYASIGITQIMANLNAIVVMPEGASGWYTDWWNDGKLGSPSWESYELDDVLPWVLDHYRIRPGRRWHAIAGISMGGLGATYLGGRLPGFFGSVATMSGFVDPQEYSSLASEGEALTALAPLKGDFNWNAVEGPPGGFYASGHNPTALVRNLLYSRVFQATGIGQPTAEGYSGPNLLEGVVGTALEGLIIHPMNLAYHAALGAAGVPSTYEVFPGGHDIPNFDAELHALLAWGLFKPVTGEPGSWSNETVATHGQLWDVGYRFDAPPDAVVTFNRSGSSLSISAAGAGVTLTTANGCTIHTATPATVALPAHC